MKLFAAFLSLSAILPWGIAQTKPKSALDKATLETYLRHVQIYRGNVTYKIDDPKPSGRLPGFSEVAVHLTFDNSAKDELYFVSADGQTIVNGDVYNINKNPFQANVDRLHLADQPSFGPANAPITLVEFGDLECPDCRQESPVLRRDVPEGYPGKVRVVFKDFPLESLHPWARAAAIAGRCVYHQHKEAFWKFYDWVYQNQEEIDGDNLKNKALAWAGQNSIDSGQLGRCIDTKATEAEVNQSIAEGRSLGVTGTPTLFINGRKIGGLIWPDLQLVINNELQYLSGN